MSSIDDDLLDPDQALTWAQYGSLTPAQRLARDRRRHQRDVALTSHERELLGAAAAAGLD